MDVEIYDHGISQTSEIFKTSEVSLFTAQPPSGYLHRFAVYQTRH